MMTRAEEIRRIDLEGRRMRERNMISIDREIKKYGGKECVSAPTIFDDLGVAGVIYSLATAMEILDNPSQGGYK